MEDRRRVASAEVDEIRIKGGGLTPDDWEYLERERPSLSETVLNLQKHLAGSVQLLAEQLNTKNTRCIYELIQNADDNHYPPTVEPFLEFTLREKYLKIESNEVGFSPENIVAISKVNGSTKGRKIGYIGQKGVGFKSVFRIAHKVHIQSEPYSFAFQYDRGDSGLSMVTPLNEPYLTIREGVQTQIILHFHNGDNWKQVLDEFLHDLPHTILLFLKKLKRITLDIDVPENARQISYSILPTDGTATKNRVRIQKLDGRIPSHYEFWVKKQQVYDMPSDGARENIDHAEIVLAFPLFREIPVIENQWISAFLPMRKESFKFLIQSDFITGANREDIQQCPWNDQLSKAIVSTFINAVKGKDGFLSHHTLRYSWVRFITTSSIGHGFWENLRTSIFDKLKLEKLFLSQDESQNIHTQNDVDVEVRWRLPRELRIVTQEYRADDDKPLLQDLRQGKTAYISERYDKTLDLPIFRKLGTPILCIAPDFIDRLSQDVDQEDDSYWKSTNFSNSWRAKMSNLLLDSIKDPTQKNIIQRIKLVPLQTSNWVSSLNSSLFYPTCNGIKIPDDLGLSLVDNNALENVSLEALLVRLGVTKCKADQIIPLIEQRYKSGNMISTTTMMDHITFLFWHNLRVPTTRYKIHLSCNEGEKFFWGDVGSGTWVYWPERDHPYSMFTLLSGEIPKELENRIKFPRVEYVTTLEQLGQRNGISGRDWLISRADIKITPRLRHRQNAGMSAELLYICEKLPQYLLGVLQNDWTSYNKSSDWDRAIRSVKVPVLGAQKKTKLKVTFLPLPSLRKVTAELDLSQEFCFLKELEEMSEIDSVKWSFLGHFGVGIKEDIGFWLALLRKLRWKENIQRDHVFRVYRQLQTFTSKEEVKILQEAFRIASLIYAPESKSSDRWRWVVLQGCIWEAPAWFLGLTALESLEDYRQLYGLFVNSLQIRNVTISDCLAMINEISQGEYADEGEQETNIDRLYTKLNELVQNEKDDTVAEDEIRSCFEDCDLVYQKAQDMWHPPSSCIWAEAHIQLPGKVSIATAYKNHASFFQNILKIAKPNLVMHIASLIEKSSDKPQKETIFQEMLNICALNPNRETLKAKLMDCRCFPMRKPNGEIEWADYTRIFVIVDRADYAGMFRNKVNTLDFTLEEVHSVKVLLVRLNLEKMYLSNAVTEETEVDEATADLRLSKDLKSKAYAITRYAAHLGAPEPLKIFSMLETVEVFSSDKIFRTVSVFQKKHRDSAFFHIEKIDGKLKMYVPRDQEQQHVCLVRQLPLRLLDLLGVRTKGKGTELSAIITASSLVVVDTLLEQDGVIDIVGVKRPEISVTRSPPTLTTFTHSAPMSIDPVLRPINPVLGTNSMRSSLEPGITGRAGSADYPGDHWSWTPSGWDSDTVYDEAEPVEQPELFQKLVDFAVQQANHIGGLPNLGSFVESSHAPQESFDHMLAIRSASATNVHNHIGALGEFFVFKVLQNLALANFDESCWRTRIRHLIAMNNQYSEIFTRVTEKDGTDIIYSDTEGQLTALLIQAGYLASNSWRDSKPTYHIEVKATMGSMNYPFFCSQAQFNRMEDMELPDGERHANDVYLIARVFGLGGDRMGMKIYLDPWKLRRRKELNFFSKVYEVTQV